MSYILERRVKVLEDLIGVSIDMSTLTATAAELNYNDITTPGTAEASKALILDSSKGISTITSATITTLTSTTIAGTASRTPVTLTATTAITAALHANRPLFITGSGAAAAMTLPEATGTGDRYTFYMGQVNTSGTTIVNADTTNCSYHGSINNLDVDSNAQTAYFTATAGGTDTITLNGTTTGGQIGDVIILVDIATDKWAVDGQVRCPAGSNVATMFSSAA